MKSRILILKPKGSFIVLYFFLIFKIYKIRKKQLKSRP